ncbi:hypothetical protein [Microlunatus soli]|uniref:Uncharacterized protein n=1 Tax=Microlunatus soli TaxID=630515 RepID=A0A1H1Z375_9ACTN|nr:hypothetical protein [Microlunatus soli]SDT28002.1 hypothetical protein SAMN04489812_4944 [Microlunatus soli]
MSFLVSVEDKVTETAREKFEWLRDQVELERLPSILNLRPLWLECLGFRMSVNDGRTPLLNEGWMQPAGLEFTERLAAQARRSV